MSKNAFQCVLFAFLFAALASACDPSPVRSPLIVGGSSDADGDGVAAGEDCDDTNPQVSTSSTYHADQDGDGLGDPDRPLSSCGQPEGYVSNSDDSEPDCATNDTDDCGECGGPGGQTYFADVDRDGLGDERISVDACSAPEGFVANSDDPEPECITNDTDECGVCGGGNRDKDCRGVCFGLSELDACGDCDGPGTTTYYADVDGDGLGDPRSPIEACSEPAGFVANSDDPEPECITNDTDSCGVCAGDGPGTYFPDLDGDGLGDPSSPLTLCQPPANYVDNGDDPEPACITNDTDSCGICGGLDADLDCNGDCFGDAFFDTCERCVGGETGREEAVDDHDDDGTPDLCDSDCVTQSRFIIQWNQVEPFSTSAGGPYTFQVVLYEGGDILFQYGNVENYAASATLGIQNDAGLRNIEFGFNSPFAEEHSTVFMGRDSEERFIADYEQDLYWLDIRPQGEALVLADDALEQVEIGFDFPFYEGVYSALTVSSNGFIGFTEPFAGFTNTEIPSEGLGAFVAPFWDDLNPARGGTIHVYHAPPTCEIDCNNVVGGFSLPGDCDTCLSGLEEGPLIDCNGECGGVAFIDGCGRCAGGNTEVEPRELDCNQVCGGEAFFDECRVCVGGDTGLEPSDPELCPQGVDLIIDGQYLRETVRLDHVEVAENDCLIQEGCVSGSGDRKVIRFGSRIANIGTEDLQLGVPTEGAEFWHFDECHSHFHFEAYASYQLFDVQNNEMLDIGSKNGFCVMDTGVYDSNLAPNGCQGYACGNQGISVGCQDTYGAGLQCQWVDVTGLPDGVYEIIVTTNPEQEIEEISYSNNSSRVRVQLTGEVVEVLDR